MSEIKPSNTDAILGGQNPPPLNAAVLGGVAVAKRQLAHELELSYEIFDELIMTHELFDFETIKLNRWDDIINTTQKQAFYYRENLGNDVLLEMVYIPAGSFIMGAPDDEDDSKIFERPQHLVNLHAFHMSKFPITQAQYQAVMMEPHLSKFQGKNLPVDSVRWIQAKAFCQNLSRKFGRFYTLPSESQWEYACRAGTTTPFYFGDTINTDIANYDGNYGYGNRLQGLKFRETTTEVGQFPPNSFGLYDLHGNIREWCEDNYHRNYINAPADGTPWINEEDRNSHILRGGFWDSIPGYCRSAARFCHREDAEQNDILTRLVDSGGTNIPLRDREPRSLHPYGFRVVC
jgi:eukaryotic-like serine/threonine-protein kinase